MRNRIVGGADFDHMFDHLQNRTTREQEYTRARKSIFFVSKSAKKTQNNPKNVKTAIGVQEAAGSNPVTRTKIGFESNSQSLFSLLSAMQILRADRLGQPSVRYAVFIFFFSAAISAFFSVIIFARASSHSSLVLAYTLNFFLLPSGILG